MAYFRCLIHFLVLLLILQGCGKATFITHANTSNISDPVAFNGIYNIVSSDTTVANNRLWTVLTKRPGRHGYKPMLYPGASRIKITKKNARRLVVELSTDSSTISKKVLKGSMDGNAFRIRKRTHYFGLPFLYMTLAHYQLQLTKNDKGQLVTDIADSHGGMILLFSGGDTNIYSFIYEKLPTAR